ncbi:hypothetical protein BGZ95_007609 [Linnemannia exigua]|uniref:Uncharacterized protein n=1 Tax=Linnemannia exigua TaxID=604196 RepID=A0AAD4DEX2_9FUNG|nr:hypothetical protein BGZ95_007609 [Linnemannia exigua]
MKFHLRQLYRVMLFREATWAIAEPILERLQSLTVPISAIECYLKVLARLERLESVQFLLDEFFDYKSKYVWSGALEEFMFPIDDRKSRAMGGMIWFVMEHGRLFPNQLVGGASVVDGEFFADAPQSCTKDIQLEVARWLPPLRDISTVTDENWLRLEAHIKMVDLERVQSIVSRDYSDDALMSLDIEIDDGDERPFLQRCRGLKTLEIMLKRANLFGWAVKEKQRALELPVSGTSSTLELPAAARTPSVHPQQDLVPLAKVTLAEYSEAMSDAVHDITFAFSLTLTHLNILVLDEDRSAPIRFGHGWADLPVLTHLTLKTTDDIADIEERLLHRCPSLISITLSDNTCYYNCLAITTNAPLNLPHLEHLDLIGRSALTFHPATLNSTPNLISLRLRMVSVSDNINDVLFIPLDHLLNQSFGIQDTSYSSSSVSTGNAPPQQPGIGSGPEVLVRPWWSWEWRLLHLKTLHLNAEFAFRFKFKMLRGCPVLESMSLEIQTRNQRHQEITQEDLFASSGSFTITPSAATTATTVTGVPEATEERIVLPRLRRLQLTGPWKIEHSVMSDLLLKMCPKVEELHLLGWKKATLVELIDIVREMYRIAGRIREVHVGTHRVVPLGLEKMRLMGMYPPAHAEVKGKEVLPIDICALGSAMEVSLRFFLLKDLIGKGSDAEF